MQVLPLCRANTPVRAGRADTDGMQIGGGLPAPAGGAPAAAYRYYFNIGSVDSFERKMEEAQEDMGLPPSAWVRAGAAPRTPAPRPGGGFRIRGHVTSRTARLALADALSVKTRVRFSKKREACSRQHLAPGRHVGRRRGGVQSGVAGSPACRWRGWGRAPRQVPITYTNEMGWTTELLRLLPTIGLIGLYIWFTRRQLGGFGGGGGGMGGRGIFIVGKAQARRCFVLYADRARWR